MCTTRYLRAMFENRIVFIVLCFYSCLLAVWNGWIAFLYALNLGMFGWRNAILPILIGIVSIIVAILFVFPRKRVLTIIFIAAYYVFYLFSHTGRNWNYQPIRSKIFEGGIFFLSYLMVCYCFYWLTQNRQWYIARKGKWAKIAVVCLAMLPWLLFIPNTLTSTQASFGQFKKALQRKDYEAALKQYVVFGLDEIIYANNILFSRMPLAPKVTGIENKPCAYIIGPDEVQGIVKSLCFGVFAPKGIKDWYVEAVASNGNRLKISQHNDAGAFWAYCPYPIPSDKKAMRTYFLRSTVVGELGGLDILGSSVGRSLTEPGKYRLIIHVIEIGGCEASAETMIDIKSSPEKLK